MNTFKKLLAGNCLILTLLLSGCGHELTDSTTNHAEHADTADVSTIQTDTITTPSQQETSLPENLFTQEDNVPRHEDGRALVTISAIGLTQEIQEAIVVFNKSNPDYYVEVYGTDIENYWEREMIELSTGKGPDLFCKTLQDSFVTCAEKGLMVDLMPYIERDLNPEDFLECSLYAYAKDSKVYALEASFSITTLLGDKDILGERTGWTFAEMNALMKAHPALKVFQNHYLGTGEFLRSYLFQGNAGYTDYEILKEVIAFDKTYKGPLPDDVMEIPGETVMVVQAIIDDALDLVDYETLYDKELTTIGYVNAERTGNYHEGFGWSINSASRQKEGAWAFLRFLLSEEYQREYVTSFSPLKAVFEEQLAYYATPITETLFIEEIGEEVTITREHTLKRATNALYGQSASVDCITEKQLQTIRNLVESSRPNCFSWDENARKIISEEADYYFNGQRDLDAVVSAIENRMNIYLSETQ